MRERPWFWATVTFLIGLGVDVSPLQSWWLTAPLWAASLGLLAWWSVPHVRALRLQWPIRRVHLEEDLPDVSGLAKQEAVPTAADGEESPPEPPAPTRNRNLQFVELLGEHVEMLVKTLGDPRSRSEDVQRAWLADHLTWQEVLRVATGTEWAMLSGFDAESTRLAGWHQASPTAMTRTRATRSLREMARKVAAGLEAIGTSISEHDRTNALGRIRALLRQQRDEGLRLIQLESPFTGAEPEDLFEQLERWAVKAADLLNDAYGEGRRYEFRDRLREGGIGGFRTSLRTYGEIISRADRMHLVDTFCFDDWEKSGPLSDVTARAEEG